MALGGGATERVPRMFSADTTTVSLVAGAVGAGSALLTIFLTPRLQHYFWKRQRRSELRLETAEEVNDIAAPFVHTVSSLVEWELSEQFLANILVVRGRVKALFSEKAFDGFLAMQYFIAASGSRVRGLGPEGKGSTDDFILASDEALRTLYEEAIGRGYWRGRG